MWNRRKQQTMLPDKSSNDVIILKGTRQEGKSYLVNHMFPACPLLFSKLGGGFRIAVI